MLFPILSHSQVCTSFLEDDNPLLPTILLFLQHSCMEFAWVTTENLNNLSELLLRLFEPRFKRGTSSRKLPQPLAKLCPILLRVVTQFRRAMTTPLAEAKPSNNAGSSLIPHPNSKNYVPEPDSTLPIENRPLFPLKTISPFCYHPLKKEKSTWNLLIEKKR